MRRALLVLLTCALVAVPGGVAVSAAAPPSPRATETASAAASSRSLFRSNCGRCHTLAAAGTSGSRGPNLDRRRLTAARVSSKIRSGGGGMPSFRGRLSSKRITAIARYVVRVSKRS